MEDLTVESINEASSLKQVFAQAYIVGLIVSIIRVKKHVWVWLCSLVNLTILLPGLLLAKVLSGILTDSGFKEEKDCNDSASADVLEESFLNFSIA